jgi:site-specific recombinase XerC
MQMDYEVENAFPQKEGRHTPLPTAYLPASFMMELSNLIAIHGKTTNLKRPGAGKAVAKVVGFDTLKARHYALIRSFRELRAMGFKMESPRNLREKHVEALVKGWESNGLSASTITNRLSVFRHFSKWIGKPSLVRESQYYVANPNSVRRTQVAIVDKSWSSTSTNVDANVLIGHVSQFDWRVGLQLKLMQCFGLRLREAVIFKPLKSIDQGVGFVSVREGTKGGRERVVSIRTERQKALVEELLSKVSRVNESLSHPDFDLKQSLRRTKYVAEHFGITKNGLGITLHGLRHQYLNDLYFEITGCHSPVRTGSVSLMISALEHDIARALVSKDAVLAGSDIRNAYICDDECEVEKGAAIMVDRLRALTNKRNLSTSERAELSVLIEQILSQISVESKKNLGGE